MREGEKDEYDLVTGVEGKSAGSSDSGADAGEQLESPAVELLLKRRSRRSSIATSSSSSDEESVPVVELLPASLINTRTASKGAAGVG